MTKQISDDRKAADILNRVNDLERDIVIAQEYLETGAHAHWHKFHAVLKNKTKAGKIQPPHPDWVRNVFIPNREKRILEAEKLLDRMGS